VIKLVRKSFRLFGRYFACFDVSILEKEDFVLERQINGERNRVCDYIQGAANDVSVHKNECQGNSHENEPPVFVELEFQGGRNFGRCRVDFVEGR